MQAFRRLLALLIVAVYLGATVIQATAMTPAPPTAMASGMMHQQDGSGDPMPCKGKASGCVTELGCIFLVSLPALPDAGLFTATEWSSVAYGGSPHFSRGLSIKPALGPPIA